MKTLLPKIICLLVIHLVASQAWGLAPPHGLQSLSPGDSLSVEAPSKVLVSPNKTFSSGFYEVGTNAYCFSIWFTNTVNRTVVWMANRDTPVNGKRSELNLHKDGNLVLTDADGSVIWETNTFSGESVKINLLETGNLVLTNKTGQAIWQSFSSPTDTLLSTQLITKNTSLVSMRAPNTYLSGYYNLHFGDDNVLNLIYNSPALSMVYWPNPDLSTFDNGRTPYNSTRLATVDKLGHFWSSDNIVANASDYGRGPIRRLTLDYDGVLRLYSLDESRGLWQVTWLPNFEACNVRGLCGVYGICAYTPKPTCSCPPGFHMVDSSDWSRGCSPNFTLSCNTSTSDLDFVQLYNTDYYGNDLITYGLNKSLAECRNLCLNDCTCIGFGYRLSGNGQCYPKGTLMHGYQIPSSNIFMHIKVPRNLTSNGRNLELSQYTLNCSNSDLVIVNQPKEKSEKTTYLRYLILFVSVSGIIEAVCIVYGWWYISRIHKNNEVIDMGYLALVMGFKRFTYAELKTATGNFRQEIGKGGFGTVYRGVVEDDTIVAVKRLEGVSQGEAEFWAEVSIIGKINHINLVKMWGFCAEGKHRLLVYEYQKNGSLDMLLFSNSSVSLGWKKRFDIALGTAKGLSYLHEECLEWVLHCDVKPQNILLDEHFQPKVADFGMSKLVEKKGQYSNFSRVRGTRGYLAPEWIVNQEITAKADVYSYGIVLLELVSGRSAASVDQDDGYHQYLVEWVNEKIQEGNGIDEIIDPRMDEEYDKKQVEQLVKVALMCVRDDKRKRPAMSEVVRLLVGDDRGILIGQ